VAALAWLHATLLKLLLWALWLLPRLALGMVKEAAALAGEAGYRWAQLGVFGVAVLGLLWASLHLWHGFAIGVIVMVGMFWAWLVSRHARDRVRRRASYRQVDRMARQVGGLAGQAAGRVQQVVVVDGGKVVTMLKSDRTTDADRELARIVEEAAAAAAGTLPDGRPIADRTAPSPLGAWRLARRRRKLREAAELVRAAAGQPRDPESGRYVRADDAG
jgi:hypothetical protein